MRRRWVGWAAAIVAAAGVVVGAWYGGVGKTRVERLVGKLASGDPATREAAREKLVALRDEMEIRQLVRCVGRPEAYGRVLEVLREMGEPAVKPILDIAREDYREADRWADSWRSALLPGRLRPSSTIRSGSGQAALAAVGAAAVPAITATLKDPDIRMRQFVVDAMHMATQTYTGTGAKSLADPAFVAPLIEATRDSDSNVRGSATFALAWCDMPAAIETLVVLLGDKDEMVRDGAAWALAQHGDQRAVPQLVDELKSRADYGSRVRAANALGNFRSKEVVDVLTVALSDDKAEVRTVAAWSLGRIGGAEARQVLVDAAETADADTRRAIDTAIEGMDRYAAAVRASLESTGAATGAEPLTLR